MFDDATRARIWSKVDRSAGSDACWPWIGKLHDGYGATSLSGKSLKAHRAVMLIEGHRIPPGHHVDHQCRNRACCNPSHLRIVTARMNTLENSVAPTAMNAAKTHCSHGHPLSGENLIERRGWRQCRECQRRVQRANNWKHRGLPRHLLATEPTA